VSKLSSSGARWEAMKLRVWERDGWTCVACGRALERSHPDPKHDATVDHVVSKREALELGWSATEIDAESNLVSMCRYDNGLKQDKPAVRVDYYSPAWFPERYAA